MTDAADAQEPPGAAEGAQGEKTVITVGAGGLWFLTPDGRPLACLEGTETGGELSLFNAAGRRVVSVGAGPQGGVVIAYSDRRDGHALLTSGDQGGLVGVENAGGVQVASMNAIADGGIVHVADGAQQSRAYLAGFGDRGEVVVKNGAGEAVGVLGAEGGDGGLVIHDRGGVLLFAVPITKYTADAGQESRQGTGQEVGILAAEGEAGQAEAPAPGVSAGGAPR